MIHEIICPCCGKTFRGELDDTCPHCDWWCDGVNLTDDEIWEEELKAPNPICLGEAREMVKKGLNIWGKPLKK